MIWLPYPTWRVWRKIRTMVWLLVVAGILGAGSISPETARWALRVVAAVANRVAERVPTASQAGTGASSVRPETGLARQSADAGRRRKRSRYEHGRDREYQ